MLLTADWPLATNIWKRTHGILSKLYSQSVRFTKERSTTRTTKAQCSSYLTVSKALYQRKIFRKKTIQKLKLVTPLTSKFSSFLKKTEGSYCRTRLPGQLKKKLQ